MRNQIYKLLVNRHIGISHRYHKIHDGTTGVAQVLSWVYLLWLNFAYYILFFRFLGELPECELYEEKKLVIGKSESAQCIEEKYRQPVEKMVESLMSYDVISFDIFDTLIFRCVGQPTDVFYFVGERLQIPDFKNIRVCAERDARMKCYERNNHYEITLSDIWNVIKEDVGMSPELGINAEVDMENNICFANPYMLKVWNQLIEAGKKIIVVSDMYLPRKVLETILKNNGYIGYLNLYISCEYGKNKATGSLYEVIKKEYKDQTIIHIGDNLHSDIKMSRKNGFSACLYRNVNYNMLLFRPYDMSYLVGSVYRGIVSSHLYNGMSTYSVEYEYGYLYGGLFVLGYCNFIHDYCKKNEVDKILFLSRDGDIVKKAYDYLYAYENNKYVFWSRKAATKLEAFFDKHDFFRRFLYHKINQNYTIRDILKSMELDFLIEDLKDWKTIWKEKIDEVEQHDIQIGSSKKKVCQFIDLYPQDILTEKNVFSLRQFIEAKWDKVIKAYQTQNVAAKKYYRQNLNDCKKVVAVDIGWAGSGALSLDYLVNKVWDISCDIIGIVAGTNTIHNAEPDASEPFLQSGKLVSYLYSQRHNRDLLKKHDPNKDYNVFWELLLSSPTPQFKGFYEGNVVRPDSEDKYDKDLDITLQFGKYDANLNGIKEIQKGILDFVSQYRTHFGDPVNGPFAYMYNISGRDAYAPMLVAASDNERYLKAIAKRFDLEINVI